MSTGSRRDMPTGPHVLLRISLLNALVTRITEDKIPFTVQQLVQNTHIRRANRRSDQHVLQARLGIHANKRLHPKLLPVALHRLMHFRIEFAVTVLRRRGCCDEPCIHHRAATYHKPLGGRIPGEAYADEPTDRLAVLERTFDRRIRQSETLLRDIHAQHLLQSNQRTALIFALWIQGLDHSQQCRRCRDRSDHAVSCPSWRRTRVQKSSITQASSQSNIAVRIAPPAPVERKTGRGINQCFLEGETCLTSMSYQ